MMTTPNKTLLECLAIELGTHMINYQIASLEIEELTKHLKDHRKDFSSRRGLIKKVAERRRLMKYLEREDEKAYATIVADLGLKTQQIKAKTA